MPPKKKQAGPAATGPAEVVAAKAAPQKKVTFDIRCNKLILTFIIAR